MTLLLIIFFTIVIVDTLALMQLFGDIEKIYREFITYEERLHSLEADRLRQMIKKGADLDNHPDTAYRART